MARDFKVGDVLIYQLESGYGLLKILAIDENQDDTIWHVAAFEDFFFDPETADLALQTPDAMGFSVPHLALTNRAFESTQTSKMTNFPVSTVEQNIVQAWRDDHNRRIHDRSIRLLLGYR
ncbi:MAG: hypothetical protein M3209_12040 [Acidobacteriota bacterium]|nr:hypothetical protein [Acidobacteriota bacterium]